MRRLIFLLCICPLGLVAQNFHFSARVGMANYQGDLQAKPVTLKQAKFMWSLGGKYDLTDHIQARTYFTFTSLAADDKKGNASMQQRNLNFATKLFDWELGAQYNFLNLNYNWWTPYVYAGVGIYHFKPYTKTVDGTKTYLQPLSTEGQGIIDGVKPYKSTQFSIPFGIGAQYSLDEDIRVGIELGYRKIFMDYLDDVSNEYIDAGTLFAARGQTAVDLAYRGYEVGAGDYPPAKTQRGNNKLNDGYYYFAATITIRSFIDQYKRIAGLPAYKRDKRVGCPASRLN